MPAAAADVENALTRYRCKCFDNGLAQWLKHGLHERVVGDPVFPRFPVPEFTL
jgi:hypothetical protein